MLDSLTNQTQLLRARLDDGKMVNQIISQKLNDEQTAKMELVQLQNQQLARIQQAHEQHEQVLG